MDKSLRRPRKSKGEIAKDAPYVGAANIRAHHREDLKKIEDLSDEEIKGHAQVYQRGRFAEALLKELRGERGLSGEREKELQHEIEEGKKSFNVLLEQSAKIIERWANYFAQLYHAEELTLDIIQDANLAALKQLKNYSGEKALVPYIRALTRFSAIKQARGAGSQANISKREYEILGDIRKVRGELKVKLKREPTIDETTDCLADLLEKREGRGKRRGRLRDLVVDFAEYYAGDISLDAPYGEDGSQSLGETVGSGSDEAAVTHSALDAAQLQRELERVIASPLIIRVIALRVQGNLSWEQISAIVRAEIEAGKLAMPTETTKGKVQGLGANALRDRFRWAMRKLKKLKIA